MEIKKERVHAEEIRFSCRVKGQEVAHAYLVLYHNDTHPFKLQGPNRPKGMLEDLATKPEHREKGYGGALIKQVKEAARQQNCYALIATHRYERPEHDALYLKHGFRDYGKEFRIDFPSERT